MDTHVHSVTMIVTLRELLIMVGGGRQGITLVWQCGKTRRELPWRQECSSVLCCSSLLDYTHTHIRTWWNNVRNASFILPFFGYHSNPSWEAEWTQERLVSHSNRGAEVKTRSVQTESSLRPESSTGSSKINWYYDDTAWVTGLPCPAHRAEGGG